MEMELLIHFSYLFIQVFLFWLFWMLLLWEQLGEYLRICIAWFKLKYFDRRKILWIIMRADWQICIADSCMTDDTGAPLRRTHFEFQRSKYHEMSNFFRWSQSILCLTDEYSTVLSRQTIDFQRSIPHFSPIFRKTTHWLRPHVCLVVVSASSSKYFLVPTQGSPNWPFVACKKQLCFPLALC